MEKAITKLKSLVSDIKKILRIKNDMPKLNGKQIIEKINSLPPDKQAEAAKLTTELYGFVRNAP